MEIPGGPLCKAHDYLTTLPYSRNSYKVTLTVNSNGKIKLKSRNKNEVSGMGSTFFSSEAREIKTHSPCRLCACRHVHLCTCRRVCLCACRCVCVQVDVHGASRPACYPAPLSTCLQEVPLSSSGILVCVPFLLRCV